MSGIKRIEIYNQIKDYLINNRIDKKEKLNIYAMAKMFNISYSLTYKYAHFALNELQNEKK